MATRCGSSTKPRGSSHEELARLGARITLGSVTDAAMVDRLVGGTDVVFHLAAAFRQINVPKRDYWTVNVEGTRHVAEACLRHQIRRLARPPLVPRGPPDPLARRGGRA